MFNQSEFEHLIRALSSTNIFRKLNNILLFLAADNELVFEHGEISKIIAIPIMDDLEAEKDESFAVELYNPTGGAQIGKHPRTVVTIINDDGIFYICKKKMNYF